MRVLIAARLSVLAEGQTGLDSQEQEVIRWAESQGHTVVGIAKDHKSGKLNLWDREDLRPWVLQPELIDTYDAIVALKVDRLTRADEEGVSHMKAWAREHGKSLLISSAEVRFPSEGAEGAMWDMYVRMAHQEWLSIQERYGRMQTFKLASHSLVGKPPWGYEVGPGHNGQGQPVKTLVPTDEGRAHVPGIFDRIIAGQPIPEVIAWLASRGARPRHGEVWSQTSISQLLHNPVYSGTRRADGTVMVDAKVDTMPCKCHAGRYVKVTKVPKPKPHAGPVLLQVEALVSVAEQAEAIEVLQRRAKPGRSPVTHAKPLLAKLVCGKPGCNATGRDLGPSPMYRIKAKGGIVYYRCWGRRVTAADGTTRRQGCGNNVNLAETDTLVTLAFEHWQDEPYSDSVYVPGDDSADAIDRLRIEMTEAIRNAEPAMIATIAQSYADKIAELEAMPHEVAHWKHTAVKNPDGTDQTIGQHFVTLDPEGRRKYLMEHDIRAWRQGVRLMVTVDGMFARKGGPSALTED